MNRVDMSEQAVLSRLRTVDKLRCLCLKLMKAEKIPDKKDQKEKQDDRQNTK